MRLAVDLDGTILTFNWSDWIRDGMKYFGRPKKGAKKTLELLQGDGHIIVIHTCRINKSINPRFSIEGLVERVRNVLDEHEIPYDQIWSGEGKPVADVYIDDRAMEFTSWKNVLEKLEVD